jgi:hypothetical protein
MRVTPTANRQIIGRYAIAPATAGWPPHLVIAAYESGLVVPTSAVGE